MVDNAVQKDKKNFYIFNLQYLWCMSKNASKVAENIIFSLIRSHGLSRLGRLRTPHGVINTPIVWISCHLGDVPGAMLSRTPWSHSGFEVDGLLVNAYDIKRRKKYFTPWFAFSLKL